MLSKRQAMVVSQGPEKQLFRWITSIEIGFEVPTKLIEWLFLRQRLYTLSIRFWSISLDSQLFVDISCWCLKSKQTTNIVKPKFKRLTPSTFTNFVLASPYCWPWFSFNIPIIYNAIKQFHTFRHAASYKIFHPCHQWHTKCSIIDNSTKGSITCKHCLCFPAI